MTIANDVVYECYSLYLPCKLMAFVRGSPVIFPQIVLRTLNSQVVMVVDAVKPEHDTVVELAE